MSISSGSSDEQERRLFFGSVKPKEDKHKGPKYPTTHPLTQANFVAIFTILTIGSYSLILGMFDQYTYVPPASFYFWLGAIFLLLWGSLYIEALPLLVTTLKKSPSRRNTATADVSSAGVGADDWRAPSIEEHPDKFNYDTGVVVRVYLLVASSIFFSCLFSMYSGGPFQSAYAQIIVAYPLFATGFARRWWSLVAIYLMTAVVAAGFQAVKSFGYFPYPTQSIEWYFAVTGILLAISLAVSLINLASERSRVKEYYEALTTKNNTQPDSPGNCYTPVDST